MLKYGEVTIKNQLDILRIRYIAQISKKGSVRYRFSKNSDSYATDYKVSCVYSVSQDTVYSV